MQRYAVPLMLFFAGALMSVAWLGHLRFRSQFGFFVALVLSWAIVLPEYILNVGATRWGYGTFTGAQMASFHLCSGVVCATLVSRFFLHEKITHTQLGGFGLLAIGMALILGK